MPVIAFSTDTHCHPLVCPSAHPQSVWTKITRLDYALTALSSGTCIGAVLLPVHGTRTAQPGHLLPCAAGVRCSRGRMQTSLVIKCSLLLTLFAAGLLSAKGRALNAGIPKRRLQRCLQGGGQAYQAAPPSGQLSPSSPTARRPVPVHIGGPGPHRRRFTLQGLCGHCGQRLGSNQRHTRRAAGSGRGFAPAPSFTVRCCCFRRLGSVQPDLACTCLPEPAACSRFAGFSPKGLKEVVRRCCRIARPFLEAVRARPRSLR